ncbi:MAG: hypothetical protein IKG42_03080 [Clostridia bacterium]|nr:hypothetical protein [Clostridia bacterium]
MVKGEKSLIDDNRILVAKMRDKEKICRVKNKITYTGFLDMYQKSVLKKELKEDNYIVFGGYDGAERELILFYPDKIDKTVAKNYFGSLLKVVRISLPNDLKGEYEHRIYLSGMMKLGIEREKFGDIIVSPNGADIVVFEDLARFIKDSLGGLKRFSKSEIEIIDLSEISNRVDEYESFSIIVPSMRIDCFVSEIGRVSRSRASEFIKENRVFINQELVFKESRSVGIGDILTIRGKGKFIIDSIERETGKRENCS